MSDTPLASALSDFDLVDFGARAALGLAFAFHAGVCFNKSVAALETVDFGWLDAHAFGQALSGLSIGFYSLTVACLFAIRLRPIRKASGVWPRAAAILGGFLMLCLLLLDQRTDLPLVSPSKSLI